MKIRTILLALAGALGSQVALAAATGCGELSNSYGPYDYRTVPPASKNIVEGHHFTSNVQMLRGGSEGYVGGDLDYVLRAIPNHPRALMQMAKLGELRHNEHPPGANYSIECYFDRAIRMAPDDPMPHMLYGIYLKDHHRKDESLAELDRAVGLEANTSDVVDLDYNVALTYADLGAWDKAQKMGKKAYENGAQLPGLKNRLIAANRWSNADH